LEYDVLDGSNCDYLDDDWLVNWAESFFNCLNSSVKQYYDNHLSVTIEPQIEGTRFFFDFRGIITNKEQIERFFERTATAPKINFHLLTDQELSLDFFLHK